MTDCSGKRIKVDSKKKKASNFIHAYKISLPECCHPSLCLLGRVRPPPGALVRAEQNHVGDDAGVGGGAADHVHRHRHVHPLQGQEDQQAKVSGEMKIGRVI